MSLDQELDQIFTPTSDPTGGNGQPVAAGNTVNRQEEEYDGPKSPEAVLLRLSDVKPQPLRWLWPGRIPLGKLSMLIGDPGLGKSLVTLDVASRVSTGTPWPDATSVDNPSGAVVLLSAEDDPEDTIVPRLMAAGADLERIVALKAVRHQDPEGGEDVFPFSLAGDMPILEKAVESIGGVRLIIVDPISAYLGGRTDSHKDADVRRVLAPLAELAAKHRLSVLAIAHLNKRPGVSVMYRAMGSMAFTAAARAVWAVTKDRDDDARRLILPVKCNLARDPTGMAYSIRDGRDDIGVVAWEADPVTISAEDALSDRGEAPALDEAVEWLGDALANGPRPSREMLQDARENGIAEKTLRRASKRLGIKPVKVAGGWRWELPIQDGQDGQAHDGQASAPEQDAEAVGSSGYQAHLARIRQAAAEKVEPNPLDTVTESG